MIKNLEVQLKELNEKIVKYDIRIRNIKPMFIQNYFRKRLNKIIEKRNQIFRDLREEVRKMHPEKFIHNPLEEHK